MPREDGGGAVELLGEHGPHQPVRPGLAAEGEPQLGRRQRPLVEPVGTADQERRRPLALVAPAGEAIGELDAGEVAAALVQGRQRRTGGHGGEQEIGLGTLAPLGWGRSPWPGPRPGAIGQVQRRA